MISRRSMLMTLPALGIGCVPASLRAAAANAVRRVAVVFPAALEPCLEAVEGLRQHLSGGEVTLDLIDMDQPSFAAADAQARARNPAAIVAVGTDAVRAVLARESSIKTVSTMTLEADRAATSQPRRVTAGVYLDIPIRSQVAELHRLFPDRARVGVIRNPARWAEAPVIHGQAPDAGELRFADCATADELLPVFLKFRRKVDFVICLPDGSLYNSATARPLIMASLENRLPIVGFSPAFVRAGAAVAIYPDYRGVGQQTGDLVRRCLEPGDCLGWETPRKVDVAVNAKVLRMLGMECRTAANPDLLVVR